ncbi:Uncharacterized protein EbC_pEb17200390 (plasmid) [Erwinia billingiae Eb661]|uniref:Uncharacterized protein n=1 Tax=Erwinia billingiae (strain Eb661) TaxID=634500 RepID=D8MJP4_ERWBE|nr:Uncharacterized protein EbC_pEb17200390 [Erwinia billingiae Eb661]
MFGADFFEKKGRSPSRKPAAVIFHKNGKPEIKKTATHGLKELTMRLLKHMTNQWYVNFFTLRG